MSLLQRSYNLAVPADHDATMRMLLCGPSTSDKTSLAMDVAYHLAKASDNDGDDTSCDVVFLLPRYKRSQLFFPVRCFNLVDEGSLGSNNNIADQSTFITDEMKYREQMKALEDEEERLRNGNNNVQERSTNTKLRHHWSGEVALKRVKVKYLDAFEDLMQFIVTLHALPTKLKPSKAIIIDDLDHFIISDQQVSNDTIHTPTNRSNLNKLSTQSSAPKLGSTVEYMKLIQTLALITDTCENLHATGSKLGEKMNVVCCFNTDRLVVPQYILSTAMNYMSTVAMIEEGKSDKPLNITSSIDANQIRSSWRLILEYNAWKQIAKLHVTSSAMDSARGRKIVTANYYRISHEWQDMMRDGYNDEDFSEADEILWRIDQ